MMDLKFDKIHRETDVLIVGAGPVGLFLAIRLQMAGIPFMLIDKRSVRDAHSKALTINPATLQALATVGVVDSISSAGIDVTEIAIRYNCNRIASMDLSTLNLPICKFTMLPQFRTEAILEERLLQLEGVVHRGVELVSLENRNCGCCVRLRSKDGSILEKECNIIVGADGFRSDVNRLAKIVNTTSETGIHFAMADAPIKWDSSVNSLTYAVSETAFMVVIPLTETLHRVVVSVAYGPVDVSNWTLDDFQHAIDLVDSGLKIGVPVWQTSTSLRTQLAQRFMFHRVILAGDASHGFSPIGGLGMATGIADAMHLSNALIAHFVTKETSPLSEYAKIRRHVATEIMSFTSSLTDVISGKDRKSMIYQTFKKCDQDALNTIAVRMSGFPFRTSF